MSKKLEDQLKHLNIPFEKWEFAETRDNKENSWSWD